MIPRRVTEHLKQQHWTAIAIDLVIVVVGVFIGLQVNNWNEARNERARERTYLERLLVDFGANVKTLESYVDGRRRDGQILTSLEVALRSGGNPPTDDALQRPLCRWGAAPLPDLRQGTYNELVSSGALSVLRDEKLRILLADYSAAEDRSAYVGTLLPALQNAAAPIEAYRSWFVAAGSAAARNGSVRCNFDIAGMRRDPRIPSVIAQFVRYQKLNEFFRSGELDSARAVEARLNELIGNHPREERISRP
jgi:hypothetical protein